MAQPYIYDFDTPIDRRGTNCSKWDGLKDEFGRDDLSAYWVADMDFKSAPEIIASLREIVEFGVFGYPIMSEPGRRAVAEWERKRHGWDVKPEDVGYMSGVVAGLAAAVCEFTAPGDGIVVQPPIYPPFFRVVTDNDRVLIENPLNETPDGYEMDFEHLKSALTPKVKAILLCSPHNPVARVWRREELAALAEICEEHEIMIISDEIHQDLVYSDARHIPMSVAAPSIDRLLVTLVAPSKTFNIAGLTASAWIARDEKIAARMKRALGRKHLSSLNMMALSALEAAYTKGAPWLEAAMSYLEKNRDLVLEFLREEMPRVKLKHPEGTYIFWLDFRDYGLKNSELTRILINEARVALNNGINFGSCGDGFARLNIGCPKAQLVDGLFRIKRAFERVM
ncbi:MAG: PatB family C-S lyase [Synergistaceae bacterium]|jgi:cystathionine beta-lyase|nr:PatB family C-S lyase [Synergistaceae bacterium]